MLIIEDWDGPPERYRMFNLRTPDWPQDLDLNTVQVAATTFGGPIAIKQGHLLGAQSFIRIFNTSGTELANLSWNHGKLITMGWSESEELVCVQDEAVVYIYDIYGNEKESYNIGKDGISTQIIEAKIFRSYSGTGIAVLTTNGQIFLKQQLTKESHTIVLPEIPKSSCWAVVTQDRNSYCLVGREMEIFKLDPLHTSGHKINRQLFGKPFYCFLHISVSFDNQNLALYTNNGLLWLGSIDMESKYCEFDTGRNDVPSQIEWIMNIDDNNAEAVVVSYPSLLMVIYRSGKKIWSIPDPAIALVAEMDGVRILTKTTHEMIQRIPMCLHNIFATNSQQPSSFLFEAHKKFQEKSHKSDEYLSRFRNNMDNAVAECIEAAGYVFCTETQKILLRAAYFGKGFIPSHNPDSYMQMLRTLRVLNMLRHHKIAMQLTYSQFQRLKPDVILDRLIYRKHYAIALEIAKDLKLSDSCILEHWAYHMILNDKNDNEVARKITEKFKIPSIEGISFCNIASKAHSVGRNELAIKLLELEPRCSLQVPLLLKLTKYNRAIQRATESGDTELVISVILEIKKKMTLTNFHMVVREYPMALSLYKKMMNEYSGTGLLFFYNAENDHRSIAEYYFRNAIECNSMESELSIVAKSYTKVRRNVEADLCSDTCKILKLQKRFASRFTSTDSQVPLYGISIHDTILQLLKMGELKEAEKIKSGFKVPDRRFWWLRIRTMAENYKWDDLEKFAKSKRSPIGYEPFVEVCLEQNNLHEARKYILKCREDRKTRWYMRAELYEEAGDCAYAQCDIDTLYAIQERASNCGNRTLLQQINTYIATLAKG